VGYTGSVSRSLEGNGISGVEISGSANMDLVNLITYVNHSDP
jgi:hypothetical protein